MEEGTSIGELMIKLVAIWMVMAPLPVVILLAAVHVVELTIVSVPFAEVHAIGTVFAVIPLMVVAMIAVVVAMMIDASTDYYLLSRSRLWRCRSRERCSQE
jgi:hypothetical protein